MSIDISQICVHDGRLLRVIEDTTRDVLTMEVELPKDKWADDLVPRFLVFEDVYNYQVFEGPCQGSPAILDMEIVGEQGRWKRVRLGTNFGYRELYCVDVKVLEREKK